MAVCLLGALAFEGCQSGSPPMLPEGYIDTPATGALLKTATPVMGWAVSEDGIEKVAIYLDRRYVMDARTGLPRPDVQKLFPSIPDAANAAWEADLKLNDVTPGAHTITAAIYSKKGAVVTMSVRTSVQ